MSFEPTLTDYDYELLSAYLDGMLTAAERAALEARLQTEPLLRRELTALRRTVALVKEMPALKAPRNFTLDAAMVAAPVVQRPRRDPRRDPRIILFPAFSALAAAAAVIMMVFGVSLLLSDTSSQDDQRQVALFSADTPTPPVAPTQEAAAMQTASAMSVTQPETALQMQVESAEDAMGSTAMEFAPPAPMQESSPDAFTTGAAVPAAFPTPSPSPMSDAEFEALEEMLFNQALGGGPGMGGGAGTPGDIGPQSGGGSAGEGDPSSSMRAAMTPPGADEGEESPALVFGVAQAPEEDDLTAESAVEDALSEDGQVVVQADAESQEAPAADTSRDTIRGAVLLGAGGALLLGAAGLYLFYRRRVL